MDTWALLAEGQPPQLYQPGQLIYLQDTQAEQFYYIQRGTVKCFLSSEEGEERTLTLHHTGDLIGEAAFFDRQPRVSSAVAVTRCSLVPVTRERLRAIFARHPELAISMLEYLARTVRMLSAHVDGMFLQADQRVVRYLLEHGTDQDLIRSTHEEIGSAVGASRVTVSRVLNDLARKGILETRYRAIRILDRERLRAVASERAGNS